MFYLRLTICVVGLFLIAVLAGDLFAQACIRGCKELAINEPYRDGSYGFCYSFDEPQAVDIYALTVSKGNVTPIDPGVKQCERRTHKSCLHVCNPIPAGSHIQTMQAEIVARMFVDQCICKEKEKMPTPKDDPGEPPLP